MYVLYLLRHGEAAPGSGYSGDLARPLTANGRARLSRLAEMLKSRGIFFDRVLVSPSRRTLETKEVFDSILGNVEFEIEDTIYDGSTSELFKVVSDQSELYHSILVIGHNPGISAFASYMTGEDFLGLSPGMLAVVVFDSEKWSMVSANSGTLVEILQ